ncbi:MAG: hypothetical protein WBA48_12345 [Xanthobacteraceae bacterium]
MTQAGQRRSLLRERKPHQHHRVTFVFAITQLSHTLLAHFTPLGVLQVGISMC